MSKPLQDTRELPVVLRVCDETSTDEIMPEGAAVLLYRSSIPKIADFEFRVVDKSYLSRALEARDADGHLVVADENNDQESSREHAVVAPRFLGLRAVLAKSVARIHYQNLVNYGIVTSLSVS